MKTHNENEYIELDESAGPVRKLSGMTGQAQDDAGQTGHAGQLLALTAENSTSDLNSLNEELR